jgi:hypothetical protein
LEANCFPSLASNSLSPQAVREPLNIIVPTSSRQTLAKREYVA